MGKTSLAGINVFLLAVIAIACSSNSDKAKVAIDTTTSSSKDLDTGSAPDSDTDTGSVADSNTGSDKDSGSVDCDPEAGDDCSYLGMIDAVFFAQTHVQKPDHEYFKLVSNREALIKIHVIAPSAPKSPEVKVTLKLGSDTLTLIAEGPDVLPESIPSEPGVVDHSKKDAFTAMIPKEWVKPGLQVIVQAAHDKVEFKELKIGAPTKVIMTMFDVHFFTSSPGDYPEGWKEELEAKWPVSELELRRLNDVVFPELVIPPRADVPAARVTSKDDYLEQTKLNFDGEQAAALQWKSALKAAAGTRGRYSLYFVNIYGVWAGGQAGGFGGVGNGTQVGILNHELGHALSLPHWGDNPDYPYKGDMYGIPAPDIYNGTHAGPTWAFHLPTRAFIPPTVQPSSVGGTVGTYKADPMQGGGQGDQEEGYLMRHFSDYSVLKMQNYLEGHVIVWNNALGSYASWNAESGDYATKVENDGVSYPVERDVQVVSVMAAISAVTPAVNFVYPPIGPYTAGLIDVFDPREAADRTKAAQLFCPKDGCDVSLKIVQGGTEKIIMLAASWDESADPLAGGSLTTRAVNLKASDGEVTKAELLLTPDAQENGLPATPQVLDSWSK